MFEKVSIQRCDSGQVESHEDSDRLGSKALYAFIYPNFMINRCVDLALLYVVWLCQLTLYSLLFFSHS